MNIKPLLPFNDTMSRPQRIWGFIFLPLHIFIIPLFVGMLGIYLPGVLTDITRNLVYYGISLLFCLVCMWKYLRRGFDFLIDNLALNAVSVFTSYVVYMLFSLIITAVLIWALGDSLSNPNNEAVASAAGGNYRAMLGLAVFIAPIVEEILFRGVLFGFLLGKNRLLAYVISITVFGLNHVWQHALIDMDWRLLLYAIQYIPAGFVLARLYERTSCIWLSIFFHMGINLFSMLLII